MVEPVIHWISGRDVASGNQYRVKLFTTATSYQDITNDVLSFNIRRSLGSFLSPLRAGTAEIRVDNHQGQYSPGLHPTQFKPNQRIEIECDYSVIDVDFKLNSSRLNIDGFSGTTTFRMFTGTVDSFEVNADDFRGEQSILCRDMVKDLANRQITTAAMTETDVNTVFSTVLAAANITNYSVGSLGETFGYYTLSSDTKALDAVNGLLTGGGYFAYVTSSGQLVIREPFFATKEKTCIASYDHFMRLDYSFNDTNLFNRVNVTGGVRAPANSLEVVATYDKEPRLYDVSLYHYYLLLLQYFPEKAALWDKNPVQFRVAFRDPINNQVTPAVGIVNPVEGTDWVLETRSGINVQSATVVISADFESAYVQVINFDRYSDYFLTKFQIRGYPFRFNSNFSAKTEMTASQSLYGIRERTFNAKFLANAQFAKTYANRVAAMYSEVTPYGRASIRNSFPSMLSLQPGDLASFVHSLSGVNSKHLVKEISHTVNAEQNGWIHEMDLQFELARTKVSSVL